MPVSREPFVQVGEYGFVFQLSTDEDLSSYSTFEIRFTDPSGTSTDKTASAITTASAGDFGWAVTSGFFDTAGLWQCQLVASSGSAKVYGDIEDFKVGNPLTAP